MIRNVINRLGSNFLKRFENHIKKMSDSVSQLVENDSNSEIQTSEKTEKNENKSEKFTKKPKLDKEERKRLLKLRRQAKKEGKSVGFYNETLKETDYYFENGLRKVYPYFFFWNTTVKERWFGKTLYEVYQSEFARAIVNQNLEKLIETGKIKVNNKIMSKDYKIKNGDRVSHAKHRHEIPVLADQIEIIHDDEDFLAVNKPCSLPMHPCGKYRFNTLSIILAKEYGYLNLRTMYRLDRLTSGIVVMGKNFKSALIIDKHIKERSAEKTYICRVVGEFPVAENRIIVDQPIDCASHKIGMYWIDGKNGKESLTEFERVSYNGKTSVVLCYPKTGRTHQIRIHLQYLGHPIVNDPLYNQKDVWGQNNGKGGVYEFTKDEIEQNFLKVHTYEAWIIKQEQNNNSENEEFKDDNTNIVEKSQEPIIQEQEQQSPVNELAPIEKRKIEENDEIENESKNKKSKSDDNTLDEVIVEETRACFNPELVSRDEECFECQQVYRDPSRKDLTMYLHALSYKFGDLKFETKLPKWANVNYDDDE